MEQELKISVPNLSSVHSTRPNYFQVLCLHIVLFFKILPTCKNVCWAPLCKFTQSEWSTHADPRFVALVTPLLCGNCCVPPAMGPFPTSGRPILHVCFLHDPRVIFSESKLDHRYYLSPMQYQTSCNKRHFCLCFAFLGRH